MPVLLSVLAGLLTAAPFLASAAAPLAWVGLVPLLVAIRARRARSPFVLGWLAGLAFFALSTHWVAAVVDQYTKLPLLVGFGLLLLMAAILACYWGAFAATLATLRSRGLSSVWLAPLVWVTFEWLRGWFFIGFPWAILGTSQHSFVDLIQFAEITGAYGVSAVIVLVNAVFADLVAAGAKRTATVPFLVAGSLVAALAFGGHWRARTLGGSAPGGSLEVAIVQGNVDEEKKWDPAFANETMRRYQSLTAGASSVHPQLIVWPETAIPFFFQDPGVRRRDLIDLVDRTGVPLLFGSPAWSFEKRKVRQLNRAYLLSPDGEAARSYDKIELVPFGEYVPYQRALWFVRRIVPAAADIVPGSDPTVFTLPGARFGVLICYEGVFPELTRRFVAGGADFLVNISNDAWFGRSAALRQHLAQVAFRAVENRVPIVRATNTGISALIDPDGSIRWQGPIDEALWHAESIHWPGVRTFYTRFGNVFAWLCAAVTVAALVIAAVRSQPRIGRRDRIAGPPRR